MKRVVSLLLVMVMLLAVGLTGCGDSGETSADAGNEPAATEESKGSEEVTDAPAEEVHLKLLIGGNGKQKDHEMVMEASNEMLQEYLPGVTFEMEIVPFGDYVQKFDLAMAAQEDLDIVWHSWSHALREVVNKGALMPLDGLMDEHAPAIREEIPEWLLAGGLVDGEQYMIPKYEMHYWQLAMYSSQADFEKYFDVETAKAAFNSDQAYIHVTEDMFGVMEDYLAAAQAGGDMGKGYSPWVLSMNEGHDFIGGRPNWTYSMPATARYYNPGQEWDFTVLNTYEREEIIAMFETYADWREKGYIVEDMMSMENPRAELENTDADNGLIWFHNYANPKQEGDYYVEERWAEANVRFPVQQYSVVNANYNDGLAIPAQAQNPEISIKFLELLETEKGKDFYNTLVYGLEGVHYNKVNDNRIETTVGEGDRRSLESTYGQAHFVLGNCHNLWVNELDPVDDYKPYWDSMHENGSVNPYGAFKYDDTNTVNEITQIRSVMGEYVKGFMCGYYTPEEYQEFLEKLDKAGVDKVIEDVQMQLDAYLEEQGIPKTGFVQ